MPESLARCTEAHGRGEPWEPILYAARPNALAEGLHAGSAIYAHFGTARFAEPGTMPPAEGVTLLRTELLGQFACAAKADAAAALALVLTVIERKTLDTAPGFMVKTNNITADIDLSRRPLEIRLAPTDARPEQRRFQHPDVAA